jgi:hypothetical protein
MPTAAIKTPKTAAEAKALAARLEAEERDLRNAAAPPVSPPKSPPAATYSTHQTMTSQPPLPPPDRLGTTPSTT